MSDALRSTPSAAALRPWRAPIVTELPKLTALTLASAIGGGGGTSGGGSTVFGLLLALGLGLSACSPDRGLGGEPTDGPAPTGQLMVCTADRAALTLSCDSPRAAPGTVILGGQGLRVGLRSSNVSYSGGTGILSADVTVTNLSAGPIGTTDGTTPSGTGVRVFFVTGPDASPTGTVTVNNATGTGTFTAGGQAYYEYSGLLATGATSGLLTWEFLFAGGATSFTFTVLVSTDVPAAGAIMRWAEEPAMNPTTWQRVRGWGSDGLALFGQYGEVLIRDTGVWISRNDPQGSGASGPTVAVGPNDLTTFLSDLSIRHWDGISWRSIEGLPTGPGNGGLVNHIGSSGKAGVCAFGFWQRCFNGSTWSDVAVTGSPNVAASTTIAGNIVVLTNQGRVWSRDSSSGTWTQIGGAGGSGQTQQPGVVFGSSTTSLWTLSTTNNTDPVIRYWDGASWATQAVPSGQENNTGIPLEGVAFSPTDAYILRPDFVGHGHVWRWDGAAWTDIKTDAFNYTGIWARSSTELYVSAAGGRVLQYDGANWTTLIGAPETAHAAWMLNNTTAFLGTQTGVILRNDGNGWNELVDLDGDLKSIWADDTASVAVANGSLNLWYYNGSGWSGYNLTGWPWHGVGGSGGDDIWYVGAFGQVYHGAAGFGGMTVDPGDLTFSDLYAVWAYDPFFAVAVGQGGVIMSWNGTSWSLATSPTGSALRSVYGTSASDVWAVGDGGVIVHYDGVSWSTVASGTGQDLRGVWATSSSEAYAVGNSKTVLVWNGTAWKPATIQSAAPGSAFYGIHGRPNGQVLVAGERTLRGTR